MNGQESLFSDLSLHYAGVQEAHQALLLLQETGCQDLIQKQVLEATTTQELPYAYRAIAVSGFLGMFTQVEPIQSIDHLALLSKSFDVTDRVNDYISTDTLTGYLNRFGLARWASQHYDPLRNTYGVLAIDLTQFKKINDSLGHDIGDDALRVACSEIAKQTRVPKKAALEQEVHDRQHHNSDVLSMARRGGDELVCVMDFNGQDLRTAAAGLHRVVRYLSGRRVTMHSKDGSLEESFGFRVGAVLTGPHRALSLEEAYKEADQICNSKRSKTDR